MQNDGRIARTIETYDATAQNYAEQTSKLLPKEKLEKFLSYLSPDSNIIDLGCGPGRDVNYFLERGHNVIGVDLSAELLNIAREKNPTTLFLQRDLREKLFDSHLFDGVWACASLLHVPRENMRATLLNIGDYLKPKGIFYFSVQEGKGEEVRISQRYGQGHGEKFWTFYEENELRGLLDNTGFEVLDFVRGEAFKPGAQPWIDFFAKKK